ncbi:MAG: hypothetical protein IKN19_03240 [Bacteroidaceae bacterium]|nr:hypothetical protein [Bacteroidaceae bacterium]
MRKFLLMLLCCCVAVGIQAQRSEYTLEKGWKFMKGEQAGAQQVSYDDAAWQTVTVPHDWAIYGPFDGNNDRQVVAIEQDGETQASAKSGRTGVNITNRFKHIFLKGSYFYSNCLFLCHF